MSSKQYEDELMPGSDEDSHDAYLEQMKAEGAEKYEESESSEGVCVCTKNVISNTHSALRTDADTTGPSLYCKKIFSNVSFVLIKFQL